MPKAKKPTDPEEISQEVEDISEDIEDISDEAEYVAQETEDIENADVNENNDDMQEIPIDEYAEPEINDTVTQEPIKTLPQPPLKEKSKTAAKPAAKLATPRTPTRQRRPAEPSILTIKSGAEVQTPQQREKEIWHDIQNAYLTKRILSGMLAGIERKENGSVTAIIYFNNFRVVIPLNEMMINIDPGRNGEQPSEVATRQSKILNNMIGADIDYIIKGIDSRSRSIVASRKDAMLKKRQTFYMDQKNGKYMADVGDIIQARIIAVAEKSIRVEAFGVECTIAGNNLSREWISDAHEFYHVGDEITIRVTEVSRESAAKLAIRAIDTRSSANGANPNNCQLQGKYAGRITDTTDGIFFIRLYNGVNAIAHTFSDVERPGKKDDVIFAVTRIDEKKNAAVGIITRIIKRNL